MAKMTVLGTEISVVRINDDDYISLTDMVHNIENNEFFILNWLRNRNTIEFLGIWERVYNPNFNPAEFDRIGMTALDWRKQNPKLDGNIRDYADIAQLVCLANLESLNAHLINDGVPQEKRIVALNKTAISQMKILTAEYGIKKLESKPIKK